jgi:hypothetical protein
VALDVTIFRLSGQAALLDHKREGLLALFVAKREEPMNRKDQFVLLVQTAAIVEAIRRENTGTFAAFAVGTALAVNEEAIPKDLDEACAQLIQHHFEGGIKPHWLLGKV